MKMRWIEITTAFPCTIGCSYCPQDVLAKAYKGDDLLTLDNFKLIINNIPKDVAIDFAGFCEPFLNPQCADMILYADYYGYEIMVDSTLVGLTDEDAERIADVPFIHFGHHDVGLPFRTYPFVGECRKPANITTRAGNLGEEPRRDGRGWCLRSPHHTVNIMMPNCDVYLCCNDFGLKHKLGNLLETDYNNLIRLDDYDLCHTCPDKIMFYPGLE